MQDLYETLFRENMSRKVEYGDSQNSFSFFIENKFPKDARILEIGSNIGSLANKVTEAGYNNLLAIDITPSAIEYGKTQYPILKEKLKLFDGNRIPAPDGNFDVVMSFDVIEHIPNVDKHFQEVRRVLKPGGLYIFQTPNKITNIPWEVIQHKSLTHWKQFHCSLHTYWHLKKRLARHGFSGTISKRTILTEYNHKKIKKKLGFLGIWLIRLFDKAPIFLSPNFWAIYAKDN